MARTGLDSYTLPSLWGGSGAERTTARWALERRPELLDLFAKHVYGRTPSGQGVTNVRERSRNETALEGMATRRELSITVSGPLGSKEVSLLLYVPNNTTRVKPAPVFLGLNFKGNHSTTLEPDVEVSQAWVKVPAERGDERRRWPMSMIVARGYAVATMHNADLEEDRPGAAAGGVRGLFESGRTPREPDAWGAIGAWAWGLSRVVDVFESLEDINASSVIVHGHSRLGKTALWAAAQDDRFAAAISNDSGCAGASLFRHLRGENVQMITTNFPHWFSRNFNNYQNAEETLPIDQHHLLALLAPRPVHVASARLDAHADPRGEYLCTLHASPIFDLFGQRGTLPGGMIPAGCDLPPAMAARFESPETGVRVGGLLSYHVREGEHDVLVEDWTHFMDFADENVVGSPPER